ncbi:sensor histidine kinase [[Ruminococcus] torques]|uniref:sensor histidine kinase n=1 Tax=[Ruminococcus] torques TaxID=33039 RepID=UPI001F933F7C|nr:sensor histidine kinase [[Ruminococcus] torques]MDM8235159.1 sensor histidine kinase [[Ruminococcus] torques]HJC80524.1 sensor histidine kinase [Candidatus Mediterraneibacter excrementipullorum]
MTHMISTYLKKNRKPILFYLLFLGVFYLVLYLYGVRADALGYAVFLSLVTFIVLGLFDLWRYQARIKTIGEAFRNMPYELGSLPAPLDIPEEKYQEEVRMLGERLVLQENDSRRSRQEMLDFYSLWAHQIKTPLAAMNLLLQSEEAREDKDAKIFQEMRMELFKTGQYVDMVLSYLRAEDMSSDLLLKEYSLDEIVRQAVRKYSAMFILKKIRLEYEPCKEMVLTDEKWLLFVLEQLLSNALKYTEKGFIRIRMEQGSPAVLLIEDSGIGIQAEDLPRVFEKGFTGYNGRQDKKSTGIGLYLCRMICEKLNHTVTITSDPGKGTAVRLDLTRKEMRHE